MVGNDEEVADWAGMVVRHSQGGVRFVITGLTGPIGSVRQATGNLMDALMIFGNEENIGRSSGRASQRCEETASLWHVCNTPASVG